MSAAGSLERATELCLRPATEQLALLHAREITAVELLEHHLALVDALDPGVNALVTRTTELALEQARAADRALADRRPTGRLHGLPVAHKDVTATAGIRTTFGSPLFADHVPDHDAIVVARMRAAGAVTLGKTNTPEFAAGSQTYNALFGATRNPYDLERTSGGSSGGAAAALACGMVALADGTDMGGSLRNPASFCNVVGLRPSPGRVSVWPTSTPWDPLVVHGPMARTVGDVALLLDVMAGPDPRAPLSLAAEPAPPLTREFGGVRVAWSTTLGGLPVDPAVTEVLERHRPVLAELGCDVAEVEPDGSDADLAFETWRAWIFALNLGGHPRDRLGTDVRWNVERGLSLTAGDLVAAERARTAALHHMREPLRDCEFLLAPTVQVLPFDVRRPYPTEVAGQAMTSYVEWMRSCSRISVAALPALSLPFGFTAGGLPVGLQVVGRPGADWSVLQLARAIERETGFGTRQPPLPAER